MGYFLNTMYSFLLMIQKDIIYTKNEDINKLIHIIRGVKVIMDKDLANLYNIETRSLKQAVNRNKKRFPSDFMFILTETEIDIMVSQNVIPSKKYLGGASPYVFTEQGVANLSSILNNDKAIEVNIQIMRAFVAMRKFISVNPQLFEKMIQVEKKLLNHDNRFEQIFKLIEERDIKPKKGIFFEGQIFDAHKFVSDLIRGARKSIILIDNFVDESVLELFNKRTKGVKTLIYTKNLTQQLKNDLVKFNDQYESIEIKEFFKSHDRFMIIDERDIYHFGAPIKDLGKKWFAFSKFGKEVLTILNKLEIGGSEKNI
jgi:hypothetical protein